MIIKKIQWNVELPTRVAKILKERKLIHNEIKKVKFIKRREDGSRKKSY